MEGLVFILPIVLIVFFLFLYLVPVGLWIQALVSIGWGQVPMLKLIIMRIRKIPPRQVVDGMISMHNPELKDIATDDLETHYLAGGSLTKVIYALIAADKANIALSYATATAIDLAGRDVQEAVMTSVHPKVIDCPATGNISAVAKDGIQLLARARVTVRTNIEQLVGGATEDTIVARVGEGIVSAIGSAENYKAVLENPDTISKAVLARGLADPAHPGSLRPKAPALLLDRDYVLFCCGLLAEKEPEAALTLGMRRLHPVGEISEDEDTDGRDPAA